MAGRGVTPPPAPVSVVDGGNNPGGSNGDGPGGRAQRVRPRSGTGSSEVGERAGEGDAGEESEEASLLVALKTAEV